jgi:outer membrane autotransporter protein
MSSTKLLLVICVTAISLFQIPNSKANALPAYTVTGPNATYTNNGTLNGEQIGIYSDTANNSITNDGTVNAGASDYSGSAYGIDSNGDSNDLTNSDTIATTAGDNGMAFGINSVGDSNNILNFSKVTSTTGINGRAWGIYSSGNTNSINNSGSIDAISGDADTLILGDSQSKGMHSLGDFNSITNSGDITLSSGAYNLSWGILSGGNNNVINNTGSITVTTGAFGDSAGIYFGGDNNIISNLGNISAISGDDGYAIGIDPGGPNTNNIITNLGSISAITGVRGNSYGIKYSGINSNISNSGEITATTADYGQAEGIYSEGDGNTITNSGSINATSGYGEQADGIYSDGGSNTIKNLGTITITAANSGWATGIYSNAITTASSINNSGSIIAAAGDDGEAYGIYIDNGIGSNTIGNSGNIYATAGDNGYAYGIASLGDLNSITNSGTITATTGAGNYAFGISSEGDGNTITNSGNITATAGDIGTAYGIASVGDGNTITNSGTISASGGAGSTAVAIENIGILTSLTNTGTISSSIAIDSTLAGASIGTITNSGNINGDINISGQDVTILGGSGSTVGSLTGGTITLTSGNNLTFGSGNQLLADNIDLGTGTVINEGSLYLNSNQSITGSYSQTSASTYNTSVDGQLDVNDTLTLAGTFNATGGNGINGNTRWTVMTAGNGINGTYTNVTSDLDLVNFALAYDANDVYMTAQANYTSAATNQNQQAVATGLQTAFYSTPSTAGQSVLDQINPMSASQAQTAFNSLSGEGISAQQTANFSATNLIVDASRRQANYWLMDECQTKASATQPNKSRHNVLPASCASRDNKRFRSWLTGVGASDSLDGSSSMGSASVSTRTGGGVVGFDYEVSSHLLVGGMVGGTSSNYNVSARSSTGTDSSGQVGLYSVAKWENFYVNSIFNYGYFSGESTRYVTGVGSTAEQTGTTSSNAFTGRMEVGYRMDHPLVNVMPFVAMQATSLQMNSFKESNTDNLGLSVAGNTTMSEPGSLGIQLDRSFDVSDKWTMYPLLRMAWVHEFQTDRSINASLQALPTSNWTVNGASAAYNAANVGISFQAMNKQGIAIFASGNAEASSTTQSYMGELGVKWLF